jgi:hypothetical protein
LQERLLPFEQLAAEIHPTLKLDAALTQLKEDFAELKEIASKHEFTPLENEVRKGLVSRLKPIAVMFIHKDLLIEITHETWTNSTTQNMRGNWPISLQNLALR